MQNRKYLHRASGLCVIVALLTLLLTLPPDTRANQTDAISIAFVPGLAQDPFYITMESGILQAARDLQVPVTIRRPASFSPAAQIPVLEALIAGSDVDYLIVAPTDMQDIIDVLARADQNGTRIITVDTFIGDSNYTNGQITFPLTHIGSDNFAGGFMACKALAERLDEGASIYIQNVRPGISTTDQRESGCQAAAYAFGMDVVGVDYNQDEPSLAHRQTTAALAAYPDLAGIFATNAFGAQGAGEAVGEAHLDRPIEILAFDAAPVAVDLLRQGTISRLIAQKPYDMGYLAVSLAVAHAHGYESFPKRIATGYALIDADTIDSAENARFIYDTALIPTQPPLEHLSVAFVPGVDEDPFFYTMARGIRLGASVYGVDLVEAAPNHFSPPAQIPVTRQIVAEHQPDYLIITPTDRDEMIPVLQEIYDAGTEVITVDTFINDGDYETGRVTFPITYIGSDNLRGGYLGCSQLAMADLMGMAAKIYVQNVRPGISTTDQREEGCLLAAEDFGLDVVKIDYSDNDVAVGKRQTVAVLSNNPDIVGIFGTNVFSAQGAGSAVQALGLNGIVEVVAYDATEFAIALLREGTVTQVIAQKPADMGYFAILSAYAHARGITSVPKRWPTDHAVINIDNVDDPAFARFIYRED